MMMQRITRCSTPHQLGGVVDGVVDGADVRASVSRSERAGLVDVEERVKVLPSTHFGEPGVGAGKTHSNLSTFLLL